MRNPNFYEWVLVLAMLLVAFVLTTALSNIHADIVELQQQVELLQTRPQ